MSELLAGLPNEGSVGIFEQPSYVAACAGHEHAQPRRLSAGGAELVLLELEDGRLSTVYGYPCPIGGSDLSELAAAVCSLRQSAHIALSPIRRGAELAQLLAGAVRAESVRPICVTSLEQDPLVGFSPAARAKLRRAARAGCEVRVGKLASWFGPFYRSQMRRVGAAPKYLFSDGHLSVLAGLPHVLVDVRDEHGLASAALFLRTGHLATYHLSARRGEPPAAPGAANLSILEGLRAVRAAGADLAILGGGRGLRRDDPLFRFKLGMATDVLPRALFCIRRERDSFPISTAPPPATY
jgi:hypothetical protein